MRIPPIEMRFCKLLWGDMARKGKIQIQEINKWLVWERCLLGRAICGTYSRASVERP